MCFRGRGNAGSLQLPRSSSRVNGDRSSPRPSRHRPRPGLLSLPPSFPRGLLRGGSSLSALRLQRGQTPGRQYSTGDGKHREESQFSPVQLLNRVPETPWTAARQTSLSITSSRSPPKLMSMESVMPSSRLILCHPLLLLPPIPPNIRVFSNESTLPMRWPKY